MCYFSPCYQWEKQAQTGRKGLWASLSKPQKPWGVVEGQAQRDVAELAGLVLSRRPTAMTYTATTTKVGVVIRSRGGSCVGAQQTRLADFSTANRRNFTWVRRRPIAVGGLSVCQSRAAAPYVAGEGVACMSAAGETERTDTMPSSCRHWVQCSNVLGWACHVVSAPSPSSLALATT
jgi:hypothetical protein